MSKLTICAVILGCTLALGASGGGGESSADGVLKLLGARLGISFTLETDDRNPGQPSPLGAVHWNRLQSTKDLEDLEAYLRKNDPQVSVERDTDDPHVVHLIDESLVKDRDYPLGLRIGGSFRYSGTPSGLVDALGHRVGVSTPKIVDEVEALQTFDYVTKISVQAKDYTVRSILSDFLPRAGYAVIVFRSSYQTVGGKAIAFVSYSGRSRNARNSAPSSQPSTREH